MPLDAVQTIPNREYFQPAFCEGNTSVVDERLIGGIDKASAA